MRRNYQQKYFPFQFRGGMHKDTEDRSQSSTEDSIDEYIYTSLVRRDYDSEGYNREGFNRTGFDRQGYNREGFNRDGFNREGFNREGFNLLGFDRFGYNRCGFDHTGKDRYGFDKFGLNRYGVDRLGYQKEDPRHLQLKYYGYVVDGITYNFRGFDQDGYDQKGRNILGLNQNGYDLEGFDQSGFNQSGYDRGGFYRSTGIRTDGFNREGFNLEGRDWLGYNRQGFDLDGYNRFGYDQQGYDRRGYDINKMHRTEKIDIDKIARLVKTDKIVELILGCLPNEPHIMEYTRQNSDKVIFCINDLRRNGHDFANSYLIVMEFNNPEYWNQLLTVLNNRVSKIMFDSSTAKFISGKLWNPNLDSPIYQLLTIDGKVYFPGIEQNVTDYIINSILKTSHHFRDVIQSRSGSLIASTKGLYVYFYKTGYPIQNTNHLISNYLVVERTK